MVICTLWHINKLSKKDMEQI